VGLLDAIEFAELASRGSAPVEGDLQALLHPGLAHTVDGRVAELERLGDLRVGPGRAAAGRIGLKKDTGVSQLASGAAALRYKGPEGLTLLGTEGDTVLGRHGDPPLASQERYRHFLPVT
jgi:hypothetical protein